MNFEQMSRSVSDFLSMFASVRSPVPSDLSVYYHYRQDLPTPAQLTLHARSCSLEPADLPRGAIMVASIQQLNANRSNALKSAGPRSEAGKAVSRRNSTRHGILSTKLLLDDEDEQAFEDLVVELTDTLKPNGALERTMVERIGITLWRQRRLVGAETATLALSRRNQRLASKVSPELESKVHGTVDAADLEPFDAEHEQWCNAIIEEYEALEDDLDPALLPKAVPFLFRQLSQDAESEDITVEAYLAARKDGLSGYVEELAKWCQEQLRIAERRPEVLAVAGQIRTKRLVLQPDLLDIFSRYQTTLDNQLYKALKALRDAQEWRLKTLEGQAVDITLDK